MDETIKKLISIDKQARVQVSKAKKERAKAVDELDKRKRELEESSEEQFKSFVSLKAEQFEKELEQARKSIEKNKEQSINKLKALYNEKGDEWINKIFDAVTHLFFDILFYN